MVSRISALDEKALTLLLKTYKALPCLWDQRHKDYTDQVERKKCYDIIMKKINVNGFQIPLKAIKKKIENMRSTYKREYGKVMAAAAKGKPYVPTLWYYKLLGFIDYSEDKIEHSVAESDNDECVEYEYLEIPEFDEIKDFKPKKRKSSEIYLDIDDVSEDESEASSPKKLIKECTVFGQTLGLQLKDMGKFQRFVAEKLMSDIIFYARLNKLNTNSVLELNSKLTLED